MLISKKRLCELFFKYTNNIYKQCGRKLSKYDELRLKKEIEKVANDYTIKNIIKNKLCKKSK